MAFLLVNDELKYKIVTTLIPTEDKLYVIGKSQKSIGLHVYTNTLLHMKVINPIWNSWQKYLEKIFMPSIYPH